MTRALLAALALVLGLAAPAAAQTGGAPDVRAPSAIVMEASTGDVAFARNASTKRSIASTTKIMTGLISAESMPLDDVLAAAPYDPGPAESVVGLRTGERMTVRDLLRALMLPSANDAAVTLATGVSGSVPAFVEEMNKRAKQLGLKDTSYANPVGLDEEGNRSSARDLVRLAAELRRNEFLRRTTDLPRATLTSGARRRVVLNRNRLVRDVAEVNGVKTGRTEQAGYVLVGSATRNGVTVLSAVLGEASEAARDADSLALLRYGLSRYQKRALVRRGQPLASAKLKYRDERVRLVAGRTVERAVRRGRKVDVRVGGVPEELDGPLNAGSRVGVVEVRERGRVVARTALVTAAPVEEAGLGTRLASMLSQPLTLVLIALVLACTVLLVLLRRRVVRRAGSHA